MAVEAESKIIERPCSHNMWEKVRKVSKAKVCLRCKACGTFWYTKLELHIKCSLFYKGKCTKGGDCEHPHIMTRGSTGRESLKSELHNVKSSKNSETRSLESSSRSSISQCLSVQSSESDTSSNSDGEISDLLTPISTLTYRHDPYVAQGYSIVGY